MTEAALLGAPGAMPALLGAGESRGQQQSACTRTGHVKGHGLSREAAALHRRPAHVAQVDREAPRESRILGLEGTASISLL